MHIKEILLEIDFTEEMRILLEVKKMCPNSCSTILFIFKNIFNQFDSVPLATLRLEILIHQKKEDFAKFLVE